MPKFDHHLHTNRHSPDSSIDPLDLIERAYEIGLDGVVITEHDYQWEADELAELASQAKGLHVFSGAEISAREGHFLVYGLPSLKEAPAGITVAELVAVVRRHGAAIVAAHPYRWDQPFGEIVEKVGPVFDAIELVSNNVTPDTRARAEELLQHRPMGRTGSSDGHEINAVGCYYTEFPQPITTMAEFVAALQSRQGRPRHRAGAWQTSGPVS
ncbi:PHP-associated domain-containing protein [Singulisphaera sp. PoT]|uniref:PHP-associated domain-containing protein n=1 Tax=Singulisphaera sp. PoT TaxID=3411797 RepID=UPI003BF5CB9F